MSVLKSNRKNFTIYNSDQLTGMIQIFITTDGSVNFNELVKENQCYLVVDSLDPNTVKEVVDKVINILKSQNYNNINLNITVLTKNDVEKQQAEDLKNISFQDDKFKVDVKSNDQDNNRAKDKQQQNNIPKEQSDKRDKLYKYLKISTKEIKIDDGSIKNYVVRTADENSMGYLLEGITPDSLITYYDEFILNGNEDIRQKLSTFTPEKVSNWLMDEIVMRENRKRYNLESPETTISENATVQEEITNQQAKDSDGTYNKELNIGIGGASTKESDNIYATLADGKVVNPEVNNLSVSVSTTSESTTIESTTSDKTDNKITDPYYSDETDNVYRANNNEDEEKNDLDEEKNGLDEEKEDKLPNKVYDRPKVKVRSLKKPHGIASFAFLIFLTVISMIIGYFVFTITR